MKYQLNKNLKKIVEFSALDNPPLLLFGCSQLAPYLETTFILYL